MRDDRPSIDVDSRRMTLGLVLLCLALPFVVMLSYRAWIFTYPSCPDPWYSLAYFRHFSESLSFIPDYYVSHRLPYLLVGHLYHLLFGSVLANYALALSYYVLATLSLALACNNVFGPRTAALATVLLGTYWLFLSEIGWTYVDGAGIAYGLVTIYLLTRGVPRNRWSTALYMAAVGASMGLQIHTNFFLITNLALYGAYVLLTRGVDKWKSIGLKAGSLVGGFLAVWLLFGLIFFLASGRTDFGLCQARFLFESASSPPQVTTESTWTAFTDKHYVFWRMPVAVGLAGLAVVPWAWRRSGRLDETSVWPLLLIAQVAGFVVMDLRGSQAAHVSYYVSYTIPLTFMAIAALLTGAVKDVRPSWVAVLVVGYVCLFAWMVRLELFLSVAPKRFTWGCSLAAVAALCLCACQSHKRRVAGLLAFVASFLALDAYAIQADRGTYAFRRDSFHSIVKAADFIDRHRAGLRELRFWYEPRTQAEHCLFTSLNSVFLWGYCPNVRPNPSSGSLQAPKLPASFTLVMLSGSPVPEHQWNDLIRPALADSHGVVVCRDKLHVKHGRLEFHVYVLKPAPADASVSRATPSGEEKE